ncbi:MAG: WcaF family extracellular polysaccharide biosynthesis acetyltransferase [Cytophagales bacterium]|nr:WcaF family extracellular polysaccharide biosynthesis acetyltransferase [Cytophagales bacterium]
MVDLSLYNNKWYHPGAGIIKRILWYYTNEIFFVSGLFPVNGLKILLLRLFGAKIGIGVVIKPHVNIKYPWHLTIGNHTWIGENVWIDCLTHVHIHDHVCISQGALILTGNHDYSKSSFDLIIKPIQIHSGAWIGSRAVVCPGVSVGHHAVLTVGSVASKDLQPCYIYKGNPAISVKYRPL